MKFSLGTAYAESSWAYSLMVFFFFLHKQLHTQAGTIVFALWSVLPHYSGRAVALVLQVICCTTDASGSSRLTAHPGSSSLVCATQQRFSSGLICWVVRALCDSGVSLTSQPSSPFESGAHGLLSVAQGCSRPLWSPCPLPLQGYTRKAETFLSEVEEPVQFPADLEQRTARRRCASRTRASTEPAPRNCSRFTEMPQAKRELW